MIDITNIKSYVINLENYKERYIVSLEKLNKFNINPERFNAIDINKLDNNYIKKVTYPSVQYTIKNGRYSHNNIGSKGAIGCYLSHVQLWQILLESNNDMFLIFEDDVKINKSIEEINNFINLINNTYSWDLILLGYNFFNLNNTDYKLTSIKHGTHAYIINKAGAKKLLNNAFPIVDQIDSYISFMGIERDVNIYLPKTPLFIQNNDFKSSIQLDQSIRPKISQYNDQFILQIIMLIIIFILVLIYLLYAKCK